MIDDPRCSDCPSRWTSIAPDVRVEYDVWKRDYFGGMDRKMDEAAWSAWKYLTAKLEDAGRVYVNKNAECLALRKQIETERPDTAKEGSGE